MNTWRKVISVVSTIALLLNSLGAPLTVLAQEATPSPTPTDVSTPVPSPTDTASPSASPTAQPTITPDVTPAETATPTPEITPAATDIMTPAPINQPVETQVPPASNQPTDLASPTAQPTIIPEAPSETGRISAAILKDTKVDTTNLAIYDVTYQTDGSATISTDKLDYAPTDSVLISGTGFIAGKTYTINITSSDAPAVNFTDSIKADSSGRIIYSYQLDGNYRPNYQVAIKDLERVVATTSFTDSGPVAGVANLTELNTALADPAVTTINITTNISVIQQINVNRSVTINGNGFTLSPTFVKINNSNNATFGIVSSGVTISNLIINGVSGTNLHGINVYTSTGVLLDGVSVLNNDYAGIVVNGSIVTVNNITTSGNGWGGINVDQGSGVTTEAKLIINGHSSHTELVPIWVDHPTNPNISVVDNHHPPQYNYQVISGVGYYTLVTSGNPSANLSQYANDTPTGWVNGNLGASKATYYEGDSVPYRMVMDNLSLTSHSLTVEWDTTKSSKHAEDYLTTFDRSVPSANPCDGVSGCSPSVFSTFPIPSDSQVTTASVPQITGNFTIYGGTITGLSAYSYANGTGFIGDKSARITITFTASVSNPVIAWGGHIATRKDWGSTNSAISIPGSPYHMRLINLDGSGGNQDRSLSADAVIFPSSITIIKDATPNGSASFPFSASPSPLANFSLVDDGTSANTKVFSGITNFQTYTVTENTPAGWSFGGISCSVTSANGGSQLTSGSTATITIKEGENVTCTYTNTLQEGSLKIVKMTTGGDATFEYNITGPTPYTTSVITSGGTGLSGPASVKSGTTYAITETQPTDWNFGSAVCDKAYTAGVSGVTGVTVLAGQLTTCTFSNTKVAKLTVHKTVTNHGLTYDTTHFAPYKVGSTEVALDQANVYNVGTYTVSETVDPNYTQTFSGACDSQGSVTLAAGDNKTCYITNEEKAARLTVNKVVKNHGLGFGVSHFAPYNVGSTSVALGVSNIFDSGSYTVTEAGDTRYTATFSGACNASGVVTLSSGDDKTCTITNEEKPSKVVVHKIVTNHGLSNDASHFAPYKVGLVTVTLDTETVMNSGNYVVTEAVDQNYAATFTAGDCDASGNITLTPGDTKSCTITNEEIPTRLIVQKTVINHGLNNNATHFAPYTIDGNTVTLGSSNIVNSGTHTVGEASDSNYNQTFSPSCAGGSITLAPGDTKTCTITNEEKAATITVHKIVKNHGLNNNASHFTPYKVGSLTVTLDEITSIDSGIYTVSEKTDSNYVATFTAGDCNAGGSVTVTPGSAKSCTITNEEIPTYLTVTKTLKPENDPGLFNLQIDGITSGSGSNVGNAGTTGKILVDSGAHTIGEVEGTATNLSNYLSAIGGGCDSNGAITLSPGDDATCTITNTRKTGYLIVNKLADTGSGKYDSLNSSTFAWGTDSQNINKVMGQTATLNTGDYNVYESTVSNYKFMGWFWGNPEENAANCDKPDYTANPTDIAVYSNETTEITLCNQFQNPKIDITKSNNAGGGISAGSTVTYTLTITNSGNINLNNVLITDFLPGGFTYVNGSTNGATFINAIGPKLTWTIDSLKANSSAIITYQVTTDSGLADGDYKNFATCQAGYREESSISCDQVNSTVKIGHGVSYSGSLGGQVLGISTELPATGSPTALLALALGLLTAGFILKKHAKN